MGFIYVFVQNFSRCLEKMRGVGIEVFVYEMTRCVELELTVAGFLSLPSLVSLCRLIVFVFRGKDNIMCLFCCFF